MSNRPKYLGVADALSGGAIGERIAELSAQRTPYQQIADTIADEFDVRVSRDTIRRWVLTPERVAS